MHKPSLRPEPDLFGDTIRSSFSCLIEGRDEVGGAKIERAGRRGRLGHSGRRGLGVAIGVRVGLRIRLPLCGSCEGTRDSHCRLLNYGFAYRKRRTTNGSPRVSMVGRSLW